MMQMLPIVLVAAVMAVDAGLRPAGAAWAISDRTLWMLLWLPPLGLAIAAWIALKWCDRRLAAGRGPRMFFTADAVMRYTRWAVVVSQLMAVLVFDGLGAVRRTVGDLILVDEFLTVLPAMLAVTWLWWAYYPLERRVIAHTTVRRLDVGAPVYDLPTRLQYVVGQTRVNLLLLLVPVLLIAATSEAIDQTWSGWGVAGDWDRAREAITTLAAVGVFVISPLLAKCVLSVQPLPAGPLRDSLVGVCARHRVGVRDLLLWDTNGTMINAAVMGLFPRLRYVLITDALLETLRHGEVQAVMAHEVGHVRRRHMLWLVLCMLACLVLMMLLVDWPMRIAAYLLRWPEGAVTLASAVLQLALGLALFGWVCRRFERQADTFAAQHLSGLGTPRQHEATVTVESVDAMRSALDVIADLNTVDPSRHSWRHGSIRWRQMYLNSIIGRPILTLPIDRIVRRVKIAAAIVLAVGVAYSIVAHMLTRSEAGFRFADAPATMMIGPAASPIIGAQP